MRIIRPSALILAGLICGHLPLRGQSNFHETFTTAPPAHGWQVFGEPALFQWNAAIQNLEVTWDSSRSNTYFHRSLSTVLTKRDNFSFAFDLQLRDIAIGTNPGKPYTFQFAAGFIPLAEATSANFLRGTGTDSPNLVEFDYFPDSGFGATVSPTIISTDMQFATSFNSPIEMTTNDWFQIAMTYTASNQTLVTVMTRNGLPFGPIQSAVLGTNFTDFHVDSFAISSYSDAGQDPQFAGSILAHGVIDNIALTVPEPPISNVSGSLANNVWRTEFAGQANWSYALERTEDFQTWSAVSPIATGVDGQMALSDTNAVIPTAFYRVHAARP